MLRPLVLILMILLASAICVILAICVAFDLAARTGNLPFDSRSGIATSDDIDTADPVAVGEHIYQRNCVGCHSIDGSTRTGPSLAGLYGSVVVLNDGSRVVVDEEHLRLAITDPGRTTRAGFPDVMPAFDDIEEEQLDALVAWIRSIQ
jgi:cytochrome c oxidase subunit II